MRFSLFKAIRNDRLLNNVADFAPFSHRRKSERARFGQR